MPLDDLVQLQHDESGHQARRGRDGGDDPASDQLGFMSGSTKAYKYIHQCTAPKTAAIVLFYSTLLPVGRRDRVILCPQVGRADDEVHVAVGVVVLLEIQGVHTQLPAVHGFESGLQVVQLFIK